jgi:hypothetical protein
MVDMGDNKLLNFASSIKKTGAITKSGVRPDLKKGGVLC